MSAKHYFLGIDIGSTTSKCVIVDNKNNIVGKSLKTGGAGTKSPEEVVQESLNQAQLSSKDVEISCATGYGRKLINWTDYELSELSCHAIGGKYLFPGVRTIIDIGGQDAKVLKLDEHGSMTKFIMNDKCAAGTGRFLDMMANAFGGKSSDLSSYDEKSESIAQISSTCSVFAESEVISKLASGESLPNIVAGVHESVVDRTVSLVKRAGIVEPVAMTGGVTLNTSLVKRLEKRLDVTIHTSPIAQYNGALGAALYAKSKFEE